jgi:hypothetical protein
MARRLLQRFGFAEGGGEHTAGGCKVERNLSEADKHKTYETIGL